jgi:membrane protein DedA with SNARE-associated domain
MRRIMLDHGELQHFVSTYGYWAVGMLVALESMAIPVPGEAVLLLAAGYAGTSQELNLWGVIAAAAGGAILGDNIGYGLGRTFGYRLVLRFGSWVGLGESRIKLGQYLFLRYGGRVVFFGRFVGLLRVLAAFLAGVNRLPWQRFLAANAAGAIVWSLLCGLVGYGLGHGAHELAGSTRLAALLLGAAGVVAALLFLHRHEARLQAAAERALPGPLRPG